jgi:serine/threonine protein kinase
MQTIQEQYNALGTASVRHKNTKEVFSVRRVYDGKQNPLHEYPEYNHNHFIEVFDARSDGRTSTVYFMTEPMESYLSLNAIIDKHNMDEQTAATLAKEILTVIQHVTELKQDYTRITPFEIFISVHGHVKLTHPRVIASDSSLVPSGFHYMAPKVIEGTEQARFSYVWSLGMILIHLMTKAVPHSDNNQIRAIFNIILCDPPPSLKGEFSDELRDFVAKCVVVDTASRPTPKELLQHKFLKSASSVRTLRWLYDSVRHDVPYKVCDEKLYDMAMSCTLVDLQISTTA